MSNFIKVRCAGCDHQDEVLPVVVRCRECDAPNLVYLGEAETYGDGVCIHVYDPWFSTQAGVRFNSKAEEKAWAKQNDMIPVDEKHLDDVLSYARKDEDEWKVDEAALMEGVREIEARKTAGSWNSETQDAFVAKHSSSSGEAPSAE
jgi:ribosomal protein S27E